MMDMMGMLRSQGVSPGELAKMQAITGRITARIAFNSRGLAVELSAPDQEAAQQAEKIAAGLAAQVASALYTLFGIQGEVVKRREG